MRFARHASMTVALALVLSGCSAGRDGGGGTAAPAHPTTTTTTPQSIHDLPGSAVPEGGTVSRPSDGVTAEVPLATPTTTGRGQATTITTAVGRNSMATTTTLPPGLPPEKCPDARTCRRYALQTSPPARWSVVNGRALIPYEANPAGCSVSSDAMQRALADAASSWEQAAPTLDFTFAGFTNKLPVPDDGHNVIGCGTSVANPKARDGSIIEADMFLGSGLTYSPCEQADNSCTPLSGDGGLDMASIATHEFGHWLWLGDMTAHAVDRELTMSPGDNETMGTRSRHWRTLALGDVLGIRALYPCSCSLPTIYSP